jgi:hypothetical protein
MSAAIDGELEPGEEPQFSLHIKECRSCRHEYELERMTKNLIHNNVSRIKVPGAVVDSIRRQLEYDQKAPLPAEGFFSRLRQHPTRIGMLALAGAGAALLLLVITPSKSHRVHTQPRDSDIIHQAYNNFDDVLDGKIVPQISTDDPASVKAFLTSKCGCTFHVPQLKEFKLVGGLHSGREKGHTVQLIYEGNHDLLYVYEAKLHDVAKGDILHLSPGILAELKETGWYVDSHDPNCSLAIWLVDSTICCAIADINKEQLLASVK